MIDRKPLGKLNSATRNTISAPKMESDDDNLNIKVVPLGDVKLFMLKTLSLEAISFSFTPCQNLMSTVLWITFVPKITFPKFSFRLDSV